MKNSIKDGGLYECKVKSDFGKYVLFAGIIGAVLFLLMFGYKPLIVTNVAFLYDAKDRALDVSDVPYHQFALDYYFRSPWSFPPGNNPEYPYPYGSSVLITDSLPLLAIPIKLFSGILPDYFQFFGIWTFICFVLQGSCASLLMRKVGIGIIPAMCAVPLFVINVPFLFRCFHHCALCGQWLILLALLGYMYNDELKMRTKSLFWIILCVICVMIQGYFLVMDGAIMVAAMIYDSLRNKKNTGKNMMIILGALGASVLAFYFCGGFASGGNLSGSWLGRFYFDILYLLDPYIFSSFFSGRRLPEFNTEHDGYLGIALIVLYLLAIAVLLLKRKEALQYMKNNTQKKVILLILMLCFALISLGPVVHFCGNTVLDMLEVLPEKIKGYIAVFRSTARFFWPVWYIMLLSVVFGLYNAFKQKMLPVLCAILIICVAVQYIEIPSKAIETRAENNVTGYPSSLENAFAQTFNDDARHMSVISNSFKELEDANVFAVHHGLTSNWGIVGRGKSSSVVEDYERLSKGEPDDRTVYLVKLEEAEIIDYSLLPDDYVIYYDNEKYVCFFNRALLKDEPNAMKIDRE